MDEDRTSRGGRVLTALLGVLLLALVATSLILVKDRRDAAEVGPERPADVGIAGWAQDRSGRAVLAARTAATTYFTLDYRRIEADMDAMRALGTPDFVEEYDATSKRLGARIQARQLVLAASLPADGSATEYLVTDRAQVLVSVDVTTTSADGGEGRTRYRTRVALDLVDGDWLVSGLDEVR